MRSVSLTDLRKQLNLLIEGIEEPIVITSYGKPVAMLVPPEYQAPSAVDSTHFRGNETDEHRWTAKMSQNGRDQLLNAINKGKKS